MRKAVLKRIKITSTGKLLRRRSGHNHFNAKASGQQQQRKKGFHAFYKATEKKMRRYI